jgi:hypothetical protein
MAIYAAQGSQTAAPKTALTIVSTTNGRSRLIEYTLSNVGAVTVDSQFEVQLQRFTAAGTTTAVTPSGTDPSDPAATLFTAGSNATVEPTYTAGVVIDDKGVNPRGLYRWTAYAPDAEIILPAVAANGVGFLLAVLGGAAKVIVDAKIRQ